MRQHWIKDKFDLFKINSVSKLSMKIIDCKNICQVILSYLHKFFHIPWFKPAKHSHWCVYTKTMLSRQSTIVSFFGSWDISIHVYKHYWLVQFEVGLFCALQQSFFPSAVQPNQSRPLGWYTNDNFSLQYRFLSSPGLFLAFCVYRPRPHCVQTALLRYSQRQEHRLYGGAPRGHAAKGETQYTTLSIQTNIVR